MILPDEPGRREGRQAGHHATLLRASADDLPLGTDELGDERLRGLLDELAGASRAGRSGRRA